jgi:uncharacterized membrane protein YkoI
LTPAAAASRALEAPDSTEEATLRADAAMTVEQAQQAVLGCLPNATIVQIVLGAEDGTVVYEVDLVAPRTPDTS